MRAGAGKYNLRARAVKDKLGPGVGNTNTQMNVLPDVYICPLRNKKVPLLPKGAVKYTLLAAKPIHRGC